MQQNNTAKKQKSKCHGNRKLQRFKRKCRSHGLNEQQIITLIQTKNHTISSEQLLDDQINTNQIKYSTDKRKRDQSQQDLVNIPVKSLSQLSISQVASKKAKCLITNEVILYNNDSNSDDQSSPQNNYPLHKPSKYLRMPRRLLLHSLCLQLNHPLKKKKEQKFILSRLAILDQHFFLNQLCYLYQTYFDQGLQHQIWPVSLPDIIQKYLEDYVKLLPNEIDHYATELIKQSFSRPTTTTTLSSLDIIDQRLKEFVRLHHLDLLKTITYLIYKLDTNVHIARLSKQLSTFNLTTKQNEILNELMTIRKKQLNIFGNLTMFEQQILCHRLPESFETLPIDDNNHEQQHVNKYNKTMKELKRQMLNVELEEYEMKIQHYEDLYQKELAAFESEISKSNSSYQMCEMGMLMHHVQTYLYHHTNLLIRQIRRKESYYHIKLIHCHHHH